MIGFPGLGIDSFQMNPIVFSVGGFSLHWYGLIIAIGFLLAVVYCLKKSKNFGITQDEFIDMLIYAVPMAIIGARLYYVIFSWSEFKNNFGNIIRIWDGGLAIYGAVIMAVITCCVFCWVRRIKPTAMLDLGAGGLLIGQAIGRLGNFVNVEVYGGETTLPWRMTVGNSPVGHHPLFFYELLWNLVGFLLINMLSKRRKFNGELILVYCAWYGIGRGVLEGMRESTYILKIADTIAVSQLVGFLTGIFAIVLIFYNFIFKSHNPEAINDWVGERDAFFNGHPVKKSNKIDILANSDEPSIEPEVVSSDTTTSDTVKSEDTKPEKPKIPENNSADLPNTADQAANILPKNQPEAAKPVGQPKQNVNNNGSNGKSNKNGKNTGNNGNNNNNNKNNGKNNNNSNNNAKKPNNNSNGNNKKSTKNGG